jgi:hypothetical protein
MTAPIVTIVNYATVPLPFTVAELAVALQAYCNNCLAPEWAVSCTVQVLDPPPAVVDLNAALVGKWGLIISDNSDQADALGYHLLGDDGEPRGFCFAETTLADGEFFSATCSHEFAEMLCDPDCDSMKGPINKQHVFYILEVCDAVENTSFLINGLQMSNFVTREWFNPASGMAIPPNAKFDFMGQLTKPLQLQAGGYVSIWSPRAGWKQNFGSAASRAHFNKRKKDNPYSRHSRRMKKASNGK